MSDFWVCFWNILIPFLGTTLGAACVFITKDKLNKNVERALSGFAAGVMVAASIWSLLIPSIDSTDKEIYGKYTFIPAAIGFAIGFFFIMLLDKIIPHLHASGTEEGNKQNHLRRDVKMVLAVTLHNIPEGMAMGVVIAGVISSNQIITISGAFVLAIGIALQNFPEGAIVSLPLHANGQKKSRAFLFGAFSGVVEPIATILTILWASQVKVILPYSLAFAAGAMIFVVIDELIPEMVEGEHNHIGATLFAIGFILMMTLDIVFG